MEILGLLAGCNKILVDPSEIEVVKRWPKPNDLTELRGFLGLVQFFKRFTRGYSESANPLTDLTKNEYKIKAWSPDCNKTFQSLRDTLKTAPILNAPRWEHEFRLHHVV